MNFNLGVIKMICYIFSISLQIAGALLLIFFLISTKRENIIRNFFGRGIILKNGNTKEIIYNKEAFLEEYRNAYLNKCSFIYIAVGYVLGIFGELKPECKLVAFFMVVLLSMLIMFLSIFGSKFLVKIFIKKSGDITDDELKKLGIEPDLESISNENIDSLFTDDNKCQYKR
jgi:hypothetical protein